MSVFNKRTAKNIIVFLLLLFFLWIGTILWERHILNVGFDLVKNGDTFEAVQKAMGKPDEVFDYKNYKYLGGEKIKDGETEYRYNPPPFHGAEAIEIFTIRFDSKGLVISKYRYESP